MFATTCGSTSITWSPTAEATRPRKRSASSEKSFPGWRELDLLVDEILGREPASRSAKPADEKRAGTTGGLVFLDTAPLELERASEPLTAPPGVETPLPSVAKGIEGALEPRPGDASIEGLVGVAQIARDMAPVSESKASMLSPDSPGPRRAGDD